mgnify:CR=1 FL=1
MKSETKTFHLNGYQFGINGFYDVSGIHGWEVNVTTPKDEFQKYFAYRLLISAVLFALVKYLPTIIKALRNRHQGK